MNKQKQWQTTTQTYCTIKDGYLKDLRKDYPVFLSKVKEQRTTQNLKMSILRLVNTNSCATFRFFHQIWSCHFSVHDLHENNIWKKNILKWTLQQQENVSVGNTWHISNSTGNILKLRKPLRIIILLAKHRVYTVNNETNNANKLFYSSSLWNVARVWRRLTHKANVWVWKQRNEHLKFAAMENDARLLAGLRSRRQNVRLRPFQNFRLRHRLPTPTPDSDFLTYWKELTAHFFLEGGNSRKRIARMLIPSN